MISPSAKDIKNIILIICCAICLAVISCGNLVDRITPASLPKQTSEYLKIPHKDLCSLYDIKSIRNDVIITHRKAQVEFLRLAQDDEAEYQDAIQFIQTAIADSQSFQDMVVGSEGNQFSVLGIMAGLTGGAALGRSFKRKGDLSPEEVAEKIAETKADIHNIYINTKNGSNNGSKTA
jgi:hypothetical protein